MKIAYRQQDAVEIFELDGEVDFHSSPELRDKLQAQVQKRADKILICLKKVKYIDSSGLATFVEALQKVKRYNGQLVLSGLAPAVRSVFEIAKLDSVFSLAHTQEEAHALLVNPKGLAPEA
ncbi:MAG TPA: STAS domain-containing protein [Verrucomicrobiae bacterium]|jgi:anti-sigma B factor antagonist|nr:STAS domain-containing protein [Verrucomicrobiae bacterium]